MAEERVRYGDADLAEFKQIILKKLEQARADYELLRSTITHSGDNDTEDTSPTFKVLEEGATTPRKEGERPSGRPPAEVYPQPGDGSRTCREQDLRHLQDHGKLIPKERLLRYPTPRSASRPRARSASSNPRRRGHPARQMPGQRNGHRENMRLAKTV